MITGWRSHYFRNNFILILIITAIPGIISALGIFWFGVAKIEDELMAKHENQVTERIENVDAQFEYLEKSLSHWAFDPRFDRSLLDLDFVYHFQETKEINKSLLVLQGSHPLINNVELFVDATEPVLFNTHYNVVTDQDEIEFLRSMINTSKDHIGWHHISHDSISFWDNDETALIHPIPGVSQSPFGMLMITVSNSRLMSLLGTVTPDDGSTTFLLNGDQDIMSSANDLSDDQFETSLKKAALNRTAQNGSFQFEWDNEYYAVSYGTMARMGEDWIYVSAAPTSAITTPVVNITKIILFVSLAALVLALIMSWFASRNIYRPIRKLVHTLVGETQKGTTAYRKDEFELIKEKWLNLEDKSEALQKQMISQTPLLRQNFLSQLKSGYLYDHSEAYLCKRMTSYGWTVEDKYFVLLDVQLVGIYESEKTIEKDESLFAFAVANIMEELAKDVFKQFTVLNHYDSSVGLFIVIDKEKHEDEIIHGYIKRIMDIINDILNLQVTVTISEKVTEIKSIYTLFNSVEQGKRYRDFNNKNQLIDLSNAHDRSGQLLYPFEMEKSIIQAVRRGRISEVEPLVKTFIQDLTHTESKEMDIQQSIVQLFSAIQHEILLSGIQPSDLYDYQTMIEQMSQIREKEWMVRLLVDQVITPYIHKLESSMDLEMKRLVETIKDYMHQHYMEDISLDSCADMSDVSSYTLSKAFNKVLGINFIDYLTDIRIEKAKELLVTTDDKIGDIAESVGYRHSYFNRVFKRQVGIPPSQYRKTKAQ